METFFAFLEAVNGVLWHDHVLFTVLAVGVLFTVWSGFGQYRALTHGVAVIRGRYDRQDDPGAISHFQALSAALSATVGLGNIAGVAVAISLGGPGAVFWMWVVGVIGMALKMTEVIQSMLFRNLDDPANPHGGPMWVAKKGLARISPRLAPLGTVIGGIFCITLLISTVTGGNMFQAWNVADISAEYFGMNRWLTGLVLTVAVALVILGGIRRIGEVAGRLVPLMCGLYILAGLAVIGIRIEDVPDMLRLIVVHAFSPTEAQGAFLGGAAGWAFLRGMQRALFSNEAGQGSAPIAHAAARTDQPVREGVVAGLEPFIDTLCVCTITALVILLSGAWNRSAEMSAADLTVISAGPGGWSLSPVTLPGDAAFKPGQSVFAVVDGPLDVQRGSERHRLHGTVVEQETGHVIDWRVLKMPGPVTVAEPGIFAEYKGATLTARAFDRVVPGLGFWLVPAVAWLFALSTMISWSYYGEQGMVYLCGRRSVTAYRLVYCALIMVAASPLIATEAELDVLSTLGTGVMLCANIPIMVIFGPLAMREYRAYIRRLDRESARTCP